MTHSKVARVYAESLYALACDNSKLEAVNLEVLNMRRVIQSSSELIRVFGSPIIKPSAKLQILKEIFNGNLSAELTCVLDLLAVKDRIDKLPEILSAFSDISDDKAGILRVTVQSAVALSSEQLQRLKNGLEKRFNKTILFNQVVKEEIIGGFIVKIGDTIIDASMANKLTELKKKFINTSLSFK